MIKIYFIIKNSKEMKFVKNFRNKYILPLLLFEILLTIVISSSDSSKYYKLK
jgi:hypothetical protein